MTVRKTTANIVFRLIVLLFSGVLAVTTLLSGIDLTAESDRISVCRRELQTLEKENEELRTAAACAVSLEELEDYARNELGMQPCEAGQIEVVGLGG